MTKKKWLIFEKSPKPGPQEIATPDPCVILKTHFWAKNEPFRVIFGESQKAKMRWFWKKGRFQVLKNDPKIGSFLRSSTELKHRSEVGRSWPGQIWKMPIFQKWAPRRGASRNLLKIGYLRGRRPGPGQVKEMAFPGTSKLTRSILR